MDSVDVSKAVEEYKQNPLMIRTWNASALEKAILISMCKYCKITGATEISLEEIWNRLSDFIVTEKRMNQLGNVSSETSNVILESPEENRAAILESPPYYVFESVIRIMCEQGMLKMHKPKSYTRFGLGSRSCLLFDCFFSTKLMPSDIAVALKGHRYLQYL